MAFRVDIIGTANIVMEIRKEGRKGLYERGKKRKKKKKKEKKKSERQRLRESDITDGEI